MYIYKSKIVRTTYTKAYIMEGNKKIEIFQKYAKNANFELISRKILIWNQNSR